MAIPVNNTAAGPSEKRKTEMLPKKYPAPMTKKSTNKGW
jgi:hypothetical protein